MRHDEFEGLVTPHLTAMLRVTRVMVGADDAEDLAQEAVTSAWRRWDGLREAGAARAWLLRITANTCLNWRRAHNIPTGRYALSLEDVPQAERQAISRADDPGASDHARRLDLRQALAALDAESQRLIALRYFAGLDSTEIGAALDVPPATVRTRLRRALGLLRQRLDGHGADATGPYHNLAASAHEKGNADV